MSFTQSIHNLLSDESAHVTVLTGAGISAESGIPTFRGPEGYWTLGSKVYMPEEVATLSMFQRHPREVWEWYLYRLGVCLHAQPNAGHRALVKLEKKLGNRFTLITQNIDNLHIRAGNSPDRTFQIHGNINFTRCSEFCTSELRQLDDALKVKRSNKELTENEIKLLKCPSCGVWLRPHVLWFDECYDEVNFKFDSSMDVAANTSLLIVTGTSGATTLPNHVVSMAYERQATIVDINPEENPFSSLASSSNGGMHIAASASEALPALCKIIDNK